MKKFLIFGILFLSACSAYGQALRFSNRRQPGVPEYAAIRLGPFYSDITFSQSVGYRYTRTTGTGTEFLFDNDRTEIDEDGSEFPLITELEMRNYLLISRHADLDISLALAYEQYPLGTQDDEFFLRLPEEGIFGNFSTALEITPFLRVTLYDNISYETDYIDTRGITDRYGGRDYEHFQNVIGFRSDWKLSRNQNLGVDVSRTDVIPADDEFDDQERITYSESLIYEYQLIEELLVGGDATFSQTDYTDSDRDDTSINDFRVFLRGAKGAGIPITDVTTFSASVGYAYAVDSSSEDERDDETSSLSGEARIETQLRQDLRHSLTYARGIRRGFTYDFEEYSSLNYAIQWSGERESVSFFAEYSESSPTGDDVNSYSDMSYGLSAVRDVLPYLDVFASTTYSIRNNDDLDEPGAVPVEWVNDYDTWVTRIGSRVDVVRSVDLEMYAQHVERFSDSDLLAYERDIIAANLTFSYRF
jgi:hypothetical protein